MKYVGKVQSQANAEVYATASGTLPNGKPVVVNSDGSVSLISAAGGGASLGAVASAGFAGGGGLVVSSLSATKFVAFARNDSGNSNAGTAIIGTVSGSSISFGSKVATSVTTYEDPHVVGLTETKFILVYKNSSGNQGKASVGTVSGTSISFGSIVTFESGQMSSNQNNSVTRLTDTKFVISYSDSSDGSKAKSIVGTISGTSVSFGSAATFATPNSSKYPTVSALSETKVIIAWSDTPSGSRGRAIVGTISGTSISYGSAVNYDTSAVTRHSIAALSDTKFVIAYQDAGNSLYYTAICGTVSGTSITLGTAVVFNAVNSQNYYPVVAKINENQFGIAFGDSSNNVYGTLIIGTASGTSLSFGTKIVYSSALSQINWATLVGTTNFVIGYDQTQFSAINYQLSSSNLTTENYIGITNGVVDYDESSGSTGPEVVFESAGVRYSRIAYDANSNKVVVAFMDGGNSSRGTAIVGTVSGTSISFGSPVVFETGSIDQATISVIFYGDSNKVVISFIDNGNSGYGKSIVGTVSGTSISFGSVVTFNARGTAMISSCYDPDTDRVVVVYKESPSSGAARVGTVSGTNISFGSAVVFENAYVEYTSTVYDTNSNKIVIAYHDGASDLGHGTAIVGTVSGTSISFGTPVTFNAATSNYTAAAFDSNLNKVVIAYSDAGNSSYGTAIVGTVSGTSISFGSEVVFEAATTTHNAVAYDENAKKVVVFYRDGGNSNYGTTTLGTVSGTGISFSTPTVFNAGHTIETSAVYDSTNKKTVLVYSDVGNSYYGTALVFSIAYDNTVRGSTASGATAIIQAGGAVNTLQTGLTPGQQYFVQTDGTLGLTAATPSVLAGTAVSATDLIVKG